MNVQEKIDSSGNSYTELYAGAAGSPALVATIRSTGILLGEGKTIDGQIASSGENADFLTVTASTSVQTPAQVAGNADAAVTARTGGTVRASDVATGGAGNVAGANLTVRPGKGTGTGTPGNVVIQAAPTAASGDNAHVPATVATISSAGLAMASGKTITGEAVIGGTAVGADLTLQSTSGVGDGTDTVIVKVGNNGATTVATFGAGTITLADAVNLVVNATTGTKIGTSASQKIGFFNATPVVQRTFIAAPTGGGTQDAEARTAIDAVRQILIDLGFMAGS